MQFMCLAYEEEQILNDLTPDEWKDLRQETLDYVDALKQSGHLISALPLRSARTAATVQVRAGKVLVTDGPFAETREQIGGFFLIEASDFEEAVGVASRWPSARLGTIEVRPVESGLDPSRRYT